MSRLLFRGPLDSPQCITKNGGFKPSGKYSSNWDMNMLETTWNYQSDHDSPTFHQLLSSRLFWKILFQSTGIFSCSSSLGSGRLLMPRSITIDTRRWCWWNVINTISKQIQIRWHFLNQTSFVATTHVLPIGDVSKMRYMIIGTKTLKSLRIGIPSAICGQLHRCIQLGMHLILTWNVQSAAAGLWLWNL